MWAEGAWRARSGSRRPGWWRGQGFSVGTAALWRGLTGSWRQGWVVRWMVLKRKFLSLDLTVRLTRESSISWLAFGSGELLENSWVITNSEVQQSISGGTLPRVDLRTKEPTGFAAPGFPRRDRPENASMRRVAHISHCGT